MNKVVLVGRLTKDVDLRYTPSGLAVAKFTIAVNRPFTNAQGEREADFIQCEVWRKQAESAANYLKKGSQAAVSGRWETGSFDGQDGKKVYTNTMICDDVRFLDSAGSRQDSGTGTGNSQSQPNTGGSTQNAGNGQQTTYTPPPQDPFINGSGPIEVSDDDLPF